MYDIVQRKVIVSHKNNIPLFDRCDVRYCTEKVIVSHKNNFHYLIDVMYDIVQEK